MLAYIKSRAKKLSEEYPKVVDVIDVKVKDYDDEHGFIGEHYIVRCITSGVDYSGTTNKIVEQEQSCLVDISEFRKFLGKQDSVIWI